MQHSEELEFLEKLSPNERRAYFLGGMVKSEEYHLDQMLQEWKAERLHGMANIREQRKRVQKWRMKLEQTKTRLSEQSTKPSQ